MTNQEMSHLIKDMMTLVKANNHLQRDNIFNRLNKVMQKLENDQELNIDNKQSLNDLMFSLYIDSTERWDFSCSTIIDFDAVREQLGCKNLEYNRYTVQEHQFKMKKIEDSKMNYRYDVGIICSVRSGADKEYIEDYIKMLESKAVRVFYPTRDTNQEDSGGIRICRDNKASFDSCREIHIIFHPESQGTLFDLGLVFNKKPIKVVNPLKRTEVKSFKNVLLDLTEENKGDILFDFEYNNDIDLTYSPC